MAILYSARAPKANGADSAPQGELAAIQPLARVYPEFTRANFKAFAAPVEIWEKHMLWAIAVKMMRAGLVRMVPLDKKRAVASLTDVGQAELKWRECSVSGDIDASRRVGAWFRNAKRPGGQIPGRKT